MTSWRNIMESRLGALHASAEDKRMTLSEAVRDFVRPGMKLNPCSLQSRPSAAVFEVCRRFQGTRPDFEIISSSLAGTYLPIIHLGLVKKAICSFAGEAYPTPGPSPVIDRALRSGDFSIENMTMLTVPQRLLAGAMGVPFIPTRSLAGSTLAKELPGVFEEISDPFGSGHHVGLLKAYRPDLSFVHVWAADRVGNALCHPPLAENVYGALAAREGAILTADHIVPTEFIRRYSNLGRIPARVVRAVCHVPFGAHPTGNFALNIPDFRPYGNDYDFMRDHRRASLKSETYDAWVREWILDMPDQEAYLNKLGDERIAKIYRVAEPESWRKELEAFDATLSRETPANGIEMMIIQASRLFARRIREQGYKNVLSGVGHATLMTWLAAHHLRDSGVDDVALMAEVGFYGQDPRPSDPFVFNYRNLPTTTMLTDIFETLGLHTGGADNRCLGAIGAAEIDRNGNVNSTRVGGRFIVGSGGANDIVSAATETMVIAQQRRQQFVERVEYVTSPGRHIRTVVSSLGWFEKNNRDELVLAGVFEQEDRSTAEIVEEIKGRCGWNLEAADEVETLHAPTQEEITLLRMFDPESLFLGKSTEAEPLAKAKV